MYFMQSWTSTAITGELQLQTFVASNCHLQYKLHIAVKSLLLQMQIMQKIILQQQY